MSDAPASQPPSPRRRGRRVLMVAGALVLLLLSLVAAASLALRSANVRQALLERASDAVRGATGLEFAAADATLDVSGRRVALERVTIAAPGARDRPFLIIERITAVLDVASMARRPLRIVDLEARGARLDLSAPLPETSTSGRDGAAAPAIEVDRFVLEGVTVIGIPVPAVAAARLGNVGLEDVGVAGSLRGGRLELAIDRGELSVSGQPPAAGLRASVAGRVAGLLQGPFTLDDLRLAGDEIAVEAEGVLGLAATDPLRVRGTVDAAPGRLFPEAGEGRVALVADLDLRALTGTIDTRANALPAELVETAMGEELFASLGGGGTFLDGEAKLRLAGRDRVSGSAHLVWREASVDRALVIADVTSVEGATQEDASAAAPPLILDLDARLFPLWSGRRSVRARFQLPTWDRIVDTEIVIGRVDIVTADLSRTIEEVEARFPALMPPLPAGLPLAGPLTLIATARGRVLDPELELDATWRPQPQASVVVRGGGRPLGGSGVGRRLSGRAVVQQLDLGAIEPLQDAIAAGYVGGVVDLDVEDDELRAHADLSARDLLLTSDRRVDAVELEVAVTPRVVRIVRGDIATGETRVEASGTLDLDLDSSRPLVGGTLDATLTRPIEGVQRVQTRLELAHGTLEVEVPAAATDYGVAHGHLTLPLGALAAVPALADAVAELPTAASSGPLELSFTAPALDASGLLRRLEIEGPDLVRGDVELAMTADLAVPAEKSAGVLTLRDFAVADRGATIAARDAVAIRLGAGRLTLAPVTVAVHREDEGSDGSANASAPADATRELELAVAGSVDLARAWRIGDPFVELIELIRVDASAEALDGAAVFAALGIDPPFESLSITGTELHLAVDPDDPAAATGSLAVDTLEATLEEGHRFHLARPLAARLADRALELEPAAIAIDEQTVTVAGNARFDPEWRTGRPATELIASLDASVRGVLDAEALSPYLAGASASGSMALDVVVNGTLDQLAGHAQLAPAGEDVEIVLLDPYYTRLTDPRVELTIAQGVVTIERASAGLNEGTLQIAGNAALSEGTLDLQATLDDVRFRLDYGLMTENEAWLRLTRTDSGALRLGGRIWLERGVLRRELDPDREVLSYLFAPEEIEAPSALDDMELDLELATVDGIRIHNNLADLRATWAPLEITGTLAAPLIDGTIDLDPGGYLFAYGQTVRVDSGRLDFAGDGSPATIDLETTTSWEDPTVAEVGPGGRTYLDSLLRPAAAAEAQASVDEAIARGFAGYYGERVARRLSESLGGVEVSLRPILIFGLDNPGTEVTVSRDLSPQMTAAVSVSLREEGRQTYIAELHELETLPRFIGQLYTLQTEPPGAVPGEVEQAAGVVAQQRLLFGGAPEEEGEGPRLRRLEIGGKPDGVSKRAIRRRLGAEKGRRLTDDAAFEAHIEVLELLRRRGYPGAEVEVTVEPVAADAGRANERADLRIAIEPGQRVEFEFRGVELHPRQRSLITSIYRPDFLEPISLEEMREQTVRELHGLGYLDPQVEIGVWPRGGAGTADPGLTLDADRLVVIEANGGRRVKPAAPRIEGIDEDAAAAVVARFLTTLSRVELALGEPAADRRLVTALEEYGYPDARVLSRRLEPITATVDEARPPAAEVEAVLPVIEVATSPRQYVGQVTIAGRLEGSGPDASSGSAAATDEMTELAGLAEMVQLEPVKALEGEPVSALRISSGALAIEDALHSRGQARVRVRPRLLPAADGGNARVLRYEVDRADLYRVADVEFAGLRSTRAAWARGVAGLEPGTPLDPEALSAARRRLYETGLFRSVLPEVDYTRGGRGAAGSAETPSSFGLEPNDADVTFSVRERPRIEFAYGLLWESDLGASVVVDAVDQNLAGRGVTLGARARYGDDDRSARLYSSLPRLLGTGASLQLFTEYLEHEDQAEDSIVDVESFEINVAAAMPLRSRLTGRVYARYLDITETNVDTDPGFPTPPLVIVVKWPSVGFQFVYEGRDDPVTTRRGTFASIDLSGADETLGSDFSYARVFTRATHHRGFELFARPVLWAQSARLGLARAFRMQQLIRQEQLFAGGVYSIRGYDEEAIRPGFLERVEEQLLLVLNEEIHVPLWRDLLTGVLFVDAGNVWQDWGSFGDEFLTAVGLGLRASTPVGLVRLDVAYPLDPLFGQEQKAKLYFGLGNVF